MIIHEKLRPRSQALLSDYIALEEGCRWVPKKANYVKSGNVTPRILGLRFVEPFLAKDKSKTFDKLDFISLAF